MWKLWSIKITFTVVIYYINIRRIKKLKHQRTFNRAKKCMSRSNQKYILLFSWSSKFLNLFFFYVSFIPFFVFDFWSLLKTKLRKYKKYYIIYVYILQGKMGKTEKNWKENHATKVTKIPKTKRRKYGMG